MSIVFTNNSSTTLASAILYTDVSFTVASGTGSDFPAISGGNVAYLTLTDGSNFEIVKVTGRSGDVFTCVRGQDGTTAVPWAAGTTVELRVTAAAMSGMAQTGNNLSDLANAGNARANLGVAIGSDVQAWDADLDAIAALTGTGILRKSGVATWVLDSVAGTVTSVNVSGGTTGLTTTGGPITSSGTITLGGTLGVGNGGTGASTASVARTNLGGTTVGSNLFTLTNPGAITFLRLNADNTVSALDAATFRTAIGAGTSSTVGTVTSVGGTGTVNGLTLTGTVTSSGNLTLGGTLDLSSPPAIGGTTPAAGTFTSVTDTGLTSGRVTYAGTSGLLQDSANLTFSGNNLGVGATLSSWGSTIRAIQFGSTGALFGQSGSENANLTSNLYFDGGSYRFMTTSAASLFSQNSGSFTFYSASGTAGAVASLSTLMSLSSTGSLTLNTGTANGVAYLNGSKVLTTGSALVFDGTNLGLGTATPNNYSGYKTLTINGTATTGGGEIDFADGGTTRGSVFSTNTGFTISSYSSVPLLFALNGSEQMRLTSTGLGIGTSSPSFPLDVKGTDRVIRVNTSVNNALIRFSYQDTAKYSLGYNNGTGFILYDDAASAYRLVVDSSGNLGLGVTPSAWGGGFKAFELVGGSVFSGASTNLGIMQNAYYDGTNYLYKTSSTAARYFQVGGQHIWYNAPSGTAGNAISFTQAMTLDANGNLGVGTTSPTSRLQLTTASGTSSGIRINQTSNGDWQIYNPASSTDLRFYDGTSDRMVLTTGGNLLVGTTTPTANAKITASGGVSLAGRGTSYALIYPDWSVYNSTSGNALVFDNGSERARIDSSGNLLVGTTATINAAKALFSFTSSNNGLYLDETSNTSGTQYVRFSQSGTTTGSITRVTTTSAVTYNTTSDYRLKTLIGDLQGSGERIDALKPVEYTWKDTGVVARGFFAHEFQTVYEHSVTGEKDAVDADGNPVYQAMQASTAEVIADLVAELQSLRKRVKQLEGN